MLTPTSAARAAAILALVWSCTGAASEWQGSKPGVTSMQELLQSFGEPAERTSPDGEEMVLDYWRERAPEGTRGVRFRVSMESGLLQRIDVFPETPPTREALEEQFGPPCVKPGKVAGKVRTPGAKAGGKKVRKPVSCYEVKVTPGNRVYFHYARSGLAVFFEGQRVHSLAYLVTPRPGRVLRKQPPLQEPPELPAPVLAAAEPAPAAKPPPEPPAAEPPPAPAPSPTEVAAEPGTPEEPDPFSTTFRPVTISQAEGGQTEPSSGPVSEPSAEPTSRTTTELPPAMSPEKENFLTLGGLFYQRADVLGSRLGSTTSVRPSLPALVNLYMDAKPSDSLRGFVVGRLVYDPLNAAGAGPQAVLDQLWFRFDIASRVFITAGRQQVKWGSSFIWNPTDFLQAPNQQPLEGIDLRLGVDMVKVNIPWEAMASNLTLLVTADLNGPGDDKLRYGAAGRADITLGNFGELSLIASFLQNRRPRYGLDWSMGLGPLDLNAELSLVRDTDVRLWQRNDGVFSERKLDGPTLLASAGMGTQFRLADVFRVGLRVEGFYNPLGYTDRAFLTWVQSTGDYRPLFFGRYYGMGQVSISRRSMYAPTLSFTGLANISDRSVTGRVDFSMAPTTAVRVFAFVEAPFGERGGEFRFQPDLSVAELPVEGLGLLRAGINVRMRI